MNFLCKSSYYPRHKSFGFFRKIRSHSAEQRSTIADIDTASDVDRIIRCQKRCQIGDVFGHTDSLHQRSFGEFLVHRFLLLRTIASWSKKFGNYGTRTTGESMWIYQFNSCWFVEVYSLDTVHTDSFGAQFQSRSFGHHVQSRFWWTVNQCVLEFSKQKKIFVKLIKLVKLF